MKLLPNTIILLHEIYDPNWLDNAFKILKRNYNMITAEELENYYYNSANLKNSCHVTFDDGDLSFYDNILPVVRKHKIPVSTYVSPLMAAEKKNFWFQEVKGYNDEKMIEIINQVTNNKNYIQRQSVKPFLKTLKLDVIWEIIRLYQKETNEPPKKPMNMTINQLREVKSSGLVEIGAHTLNHPILINENDDFAKMEIEKSIDFLGDILNIGIKYFAYPNGNYSNREIEILRNKGIKLAFSTKRGKISLENNKYSIPRSGSPMVSEVQNNRIYSNIKSIFQVIAGEERYNKYQKILRS